MPPVAPLNAKPEGTFFKVNGGNCGPFPGRFSFTAMEQAKFLKRSAIDWTLTTPAGRTTFKLEKKKLVVNGKSLPFEGAVTMESVIVECAVQANRVDCRANGLVLPAVGGNFAGAALSINGELISRFEGTGQAK